MPRQLLMIRLYVSFIQIVILRNEGEGKTRDKVSVHNNNIDKTFTSCQSQKSNLLQHYKLKTKVMGVLATRNKVGVKNNVGVNSVHCTLKSSLEHTITTKKETARC